MSFKGMTSMPVSLNIFGEKREVDVPVLFLDGYRVRPMLKTDFEAVEEFQDPHIAESLTVEHLIELTEHGYTFEKNKKGIVGFIAETIVESDKEKEIVGRSYVKTWHISNFSKPKYKLTESGGIEVITSEDLLKNKECIVEVGGNLVKKEHRNRKLGTALTYIRMAFIKMMQEQGFKAECIFITNVGVLIPESNHLKKDYAKLLLKKIHEKGKISKPSIDNLHEACNKGEILSADEFYEIFDNLKVDVIIEGSIEKTPYYFGAPRLESTPAFLIGKRMIKERPLITLNGESILSPIKFEDTACMHPEHGGIYAISYPK